MTRSGAPRHPTSAGVFDARRSGARTLVAGAVIAISSTTIIARVFGEQGIRGKLRDLVVGVLIVEDLVALLLMAILTALSTKRRGRRSRRARCCGP